MYCVYILHSQKLNRFYIGTTDDFQKRLDEHNQAVHPDAFTTRGIPWAPFLVIDTLTSAQAYAIERHLKKMKSSVYIKKLAIQPMMIEALKQKFG